MTTAGGTSAPFAWDAINPNLGDLSDVASDPSSGALYVSTYNGNVIQQINPNTGGPSARRWPCPAATRTG